MNSNKELHEWLKKLCGRSESWRDYCEMFHDHLTSSGASPEMMLTCRDSTALWGAKVTEVFDGRYMVTLYGNGGHEGEGETVERVIGVFSDKNKPADFYFRVCGYYESSEGVTWDELENSTLVRPERIETVDWRNV